MRPEKCLLVLGVSLCTGYASVGFAQPPDRLDSYRVLPKFSSFTQTGGFAGVEHKYPLRGGYDFLRQWTGGTPDEPYRLTARFSDADLRAPLGPMLPAFIDVDDLLNLESLRGEFLPLPFAFTPIEVFRFEGIINDSPAASPLEQSTIELYAATFGPWMYLSGDTRQRPWSADRFEYQINALARSGDWSDWNGDGVVNAADYTLLLDQHATVGDNPSASDNAPDQAIARYQLDYGQTVPDAAVFEEIIAVAMQRNALSVPEPTGLLLIALATATLGLGSRRFGCRL